MSIISPKIGKVVKKVLYRLMSQMFPRCLPLVRQLILLDFAAPPAGCRPPSGVGCLLGRLGSRWIEAGPEPGPCWYEFVLGLGVVIYSRWPAFGGCEVEQS